MMQSEEAAELQEQQHGAATDEVEEEQDQDGGVEPAAAADREPSVHSRSDSLVRKMQLPPEAPASDAHPEAAAEDHDREAPVGGAAQPLHPAAGEDAGADTHRSMLTSSSALDGELQEHDLSAQASSTGMNGSTSSRPGSAAAGNLRGSRPCSAAIAAQIEGFEDDFMGAEAHHMLLHEVPEDDAGSDAQAEPTAEELIAEQQQELAVLREVNEGLQQLARLVLEHRNKGRPPINRDLARLDGADARYRMALKTWVELRKEQQQVAAHYQASICDMKAALEGRIQRADEVAATLKHFKREVALAAEDANTGRPVPRKALADLEEREQALDEEVQRVRLKNIHLANALKKLESTLRNKEQLAEGLHLIDFEQLKIENNCLNEKIEERNEELIKLRKKTTVTVQILTHMKAKLAFVECENAALCEDLAQVEAALAGKRDELASLKATRDRLRQQGRALKEGSEFVTNPMLLQDMKAQKDKRDDLLAEIEVLKQQHAAATAGAPAGGSPAGSSAGGASSAGASPPPGKLLSPKHRSSSSKAASLRLQVALAPRMR